MRSRPLAAALLLLAGCSRPIVVVPPAEQVRAERSRQLLAVVHSLGQDGDWLVVRGYHATDHLVSAVTNAPFSHVAMLDLEREQVIEADRTGVHATPLAAFAPRCHRLLLVRPKWADATRGREALVRVRALVGRPYDFSGLAGVDVPDRYYCSELAVAGYRPWVKAGDHVPPVIPPAQMHFWGRILWDSGDPPG